MRASLPHQVRNDHYVLKLKLKGLTASSELEEWTAAIRTRNRWKIGEQLQVPRDLLQKAKARGEQLAVRLEPVVKGLTDRLLMDDPISIEAANKLLSGFLQWAKDIEKPAVLSLAGPMVSRAFERLRYSSVRRCPEFINSCPQ